MSEFKVHTLQNKLRVLYLPTTSKVSHLGFMVDAGTRDEPENQEGLAHYIEHAIFKGTHKRKAYHILSRLDRVGGELNAFTGKEDTTIHASFLTQYFERAAEIVSDIVFHSTFPEKEIQKEKEVILDEIHSYQDSPSELIFDEFEELVFKNHPLQHPVLGTEESVKSLTREDIINFMREKYTLDRMVLCVATNLSSKKVLTTLNKYFGEIETKVNNKRSFEKLIYTPFHEEKKMDTYQAHYMLGNEAFDIHHPLKNACSLLNNILGGPGLNSLLNLEVREKHGIAYNIESSYQPYSDTGVLFIYLGTDVNQLGKSQKLIEKIIKKLCNQKLGILQLHQAKKQIIGHIALGQDNNSSHMLNLAKSLLLYDKIDSDEAIEKKLQQITDIQIMEAAQQVLNLNNMSTLIYK